MGQQGGVRIESQLHAKVLPEVMWPLRPRRRSCAHLTTASSVCYAGLPCIHEMCCLYNKA